MSASCPCGSSFDYLTCCGQYIEQHQVPLTPEALMRSRYSAYTRANMDYIQQTMRGKPALGFDANQVGKWAKKVWWLRLQVMNATMINDTQGYVEFVATYLEGAYLHQMHERSEFVYDQGRWFYVDGTQPTLSLALKQLMTRNMPCPCGHGKRFKNCHGRAHDH
jgi:SEC-C motif-containing protein